MITIQCDKCDYRMWVGNIEIGYSMDELDTMDDLLNKQFHIINIGNEKKLLCDHCLNIYSKLEQEVIKEKNKVLRKFFEDKK